MSFPLQHRRTSPDDCSPGDYLREEDCPEWRGGVEAVTFQPGHEPGAANPFDDAAYKMEVPEDWVFEPQVMTDATGSHRVWTRIR
ncbi:hypothetical protein KBB96_10950 [Luteolibacter ambystomatis]|uniref:Uncharacterized protein n=1 Tax=Luteolibacter ambystomatis TaxID=2824561 RepID=A0A975G5C2_9BACT|nr:hypothetical protein [Luteolibacter ambystomatis]QUE49389.1 hypothetical protein KBB96_10950 [Luteolibacter ambystomatis]